MTIQWKEFELATYRDVVSLVFITSNDVYWYILERDTNNLLSRGSHPSLVWAKRAAESALIRHAERTPRRPDESVNSDEKIAGWSA